MNRSLTVLLICMLLLSGCKDRPVIAPAPDPDPLPPPVPEPPQVLAVALSSAVDSFHPAQAVTGAELTLANCLYEGLARVDDRGALQPALATDWSVDEQGLVWTISLRPGLQWSSGDPLTADCVRDGWLRLLRPETNSPWSYLLEPVEQIRAVDARTLAVHLSRPVPQFDSLLAHPALFPAPHDGPVSGPYVIAGQHPRGLVLSPNPRYWNGDRARLTELKLYLVDSAREGLGLFLEGEVQVVDHAPEVEQQWLDDRGWLHGGPDRATYFLLANVRGALSDPRVRQALSLSLDRDWLTREVTRGREVPARGFVPPGLQDPDFRDVTGDLVPPPDPAAARRLLSEAGYPGARGFPELTALTNASDFHRAVLQGVSRWWERELALEPLVIEELDWNRYLHRREAGEFDLARAGWGLDYLDPMSMLEPFVPGGKFSGTGWHSPDFLHEVARAKGPDRISALAAAEAILAAELPAIPLFHYWDSWLVKPEVTGLVRHPIGPSFCFVGVRIVHPR